MLHACAFTRVQIDPTQRIPAAAAPLPRQPDIALKNSRNFFTAREVM